MGWMWSNSSKEAQTQPTQAISETPIDEAIQTAPTSPPTAIPQTSRTLTRDEQADAELQEFLKELNTIPSTLPPSSEPAASSSATPLNNTISPLALHPTTMSCRAAFDSAFYCQSLGGQFTSLYRYGGMRDCSDQWSNFWFCMRTNRGPMSEEERKSRIQKHYQERERKYQLGPSSEDVWGSREEKIEGAFEGDFEAVEAEMRQEEEKRSGMGG